MNEPYCQGPDWKPRATTKEPGTCGACGKALVGQRTCYCSSECSARYVANHFWGDARNAASRRDGGICQRCGEVANGSREIISRDGHYIGTRIIAAEVNHIDPRNGAGYANGCHNHQEGLETLCHDCHVKTTTQQGRDRKAERLGYRQPELVA